MSGAVAHAARRVTLARTDGQLFRERIGFVVLCIIGVYCSMQLLVELKSILEPFLWALFLVMAWKPVVDGFERSIERFLAATCCCLRTLPGEESGRYSPVPAVEQRDTRNEELQPMISDDDEMGSPRSTIGKPASGGGSFDDATFDLEHSGAEHSRPAYAERSKRTFAAGNRLKQAADVDSDEEQEMGEGGWKQSARAKLARALAVNAAVMTTVGAIYCLGLLILESARHMQEHWDVYTKGGKNLATEIAGTLSYLSLKVPESMKLRYEDVTADILKTVQDMLYGLVGDLVNNISSLFVGILLTLLYTLFWLCSPMPLSASVDGMFRRYIMFKTLACFGYGLCVGLLLAALSVDLASVFALTTFTLNYVPEVGPFISMMLPVPVILLDSRLDRPFLVLFISIIGQLGLKFAFSNIIEVKLIESDKKLRMHPVMILLSVGVFGHLWGPTGMLLSVPLMALLKISLFSDLVPSSYRDPILVLLEGDRNAPARHGLRPDAPTASRSRRVPRRAAPGG